jgi:hypothetical protein
MEDTVELCEMCENGFIIDGECECCSNITEINEIYDGDATAAAW